MKKVLLLIAILSILSFEGHAQRVYKTTIGKYILDCSAASRMPQGAVTTIPKCRATNVTNTALSGNPSDENYLVFRKLEVAPMDMNIANEFSTTGTFIMNWAEAYNGCKAVTYDGGGWRLPTVRELQLLYIFRAAFASLGAPFSTSTFSYSYWSSSEVDASTSLSVSFRASESGTTSSAPKSNNGWYPVRCVREMP